MANAGACLSALHIQPALLSGSNDRGREKRDRDFYLACTCSSLGRWRLGYAGTRLAGTAYYSTAQRSTAQQAKLHGKQNGTQQHSQIERCQRFSVACCQLRTARSNAAAPHSQMECRNAAQLDGMPQFRLAIQCCQRGQHYGNAPRRGCRPSPLWLSKQAAVKVVLSLVSRWLLCRTLA